MEIIPRLQAPSIAEGLLFLRPNQAPRSFSLTLPNGVSAVKNIILQNVKNTIFKIHNI